MDKKEQAIHDRIVEQIKSLKSASYTGKIAITVEINLSQGFIGSAFMNVKENINFGEIK
jgi:hypothetical protein